MTPFFSSTLSALFVTLIFVCETRQNSFSCGAPFGPFWSVKYLVFKLPIQTAHLTVLERGQPEVTKNPYFVLSPEGSQKKGISSWTKNKQLLLTASFTVKFELVFVLKPENTLS